MIQSGAVMQSERGGLCLLVAVLVAVRRSKGAANELLVVAAKNITFTLCLPVNRDNKRPWSLATKSVRVSHFRPSVAIVVARNSRHLRVTGRLADVVACRGT